VIVPNVEAILPDVLADDASEFVFVAVSRKFANPIASSTATGMKCSIRSASHSVGSVIRNAGRYPASV